MAFVFLRVGNIRQTFSLKCVLLLLERLVIIQHTSFDKIKNSGLTCDKTAVLCLYFNMCLGYSVSNCANKAGITTMFNRVELKSPPKIT